jgi:hypothetical protein
MAQKTTMPMMGATHTGMLGSVLPLSKGLGDEVGVGTALGLGVSTSRAMRKEVVGAILLLCVMSTENSEKLEKRSPYLYALGK